MRFLLKMVPCLLVACAPTLKLKTHPASINLCPYFPAGEDTNVVDAYRAELTVRHIRDSVFLKSVSCDSAAYPGLKLAYGRTGLVGSAERSSAIALTAVGVGVPIAMIAAGIPFFVGFWSTPSNQLAVDADLADSLETETKPARLFVHTSGWTGDRQSQIDRQAAESGRVLDGILKQIKGPK